MIRKYLVVTLLISLLIGLLLANRAAAIALEEGPWTEAPISSGLDLNLSTGTADRAATNPKLDSALAGLVTSRDGHTTDLPGITMIAGRTQVQIVVLPENEAAARLLVSQASGEITGAFDGLLQAWLPPEALPALAAESAIEYIQAPNTMVPAETDAIAALTEGVAASGADTWQAAGWRGQGVRIAIIDGGFEGYPARLGSDLPASVTVRNFVDGQTQAEVDGSTRHGTACAEIVHDMAPEARLYLLKINTDVDLNEAVDYAISQGVDIISTSLTFINVTPGDGTGRFATMAQKARAAGILWTTAAGNYRQTHWSGAFTDADSDGFHEYAPGVEVNVFGPGNGTAYSIPAGIVLTPSIRWNDWTAVNQDLRLVLLRHNGTSFDIVATGNNAQSGLSGQRPTERISYLTSGPAAIYGVAIQKVSVNRNIHLHLLTPNRNLDRQIPAMSLGNLADVATVLTVAAVDAKTPFVREAYSSEGPTNGPGGAPTGGFRKPDLAAFANVSTASFGTRIFNGTSAATPHVAGAAALVLSTYPTAVPGEVQDYLQTTAIDQGLFGPDAQYGYGRLRLGAPLTPGNFPYHSFTPLVVTKTQ